MYNKEGSSGEQQGTAICRPTAWNSAAQRLPVCFKKAKLRGKRNPADLQALFRCPESLRRGAREPNAPTSTMKNARAPSFCELSGHVSYDPGTAHRSRTSCRTYGL